MPEQNEWVLWENDEMSLQAAFNPAIPREEGLHIVLLQKNRFYSADEVTPDPLHNVDPVLREHERIPKKPVPSPWADPELYSRMSLVAAKVSGIITRLGMADWVNIHCDGNIGAAKGDPVMHIHIFGRLKTGSGWGGPLHLPSGEGPYGHEPLSDQDREQLRSTLKYMVTEDMPEIQIALRELRKLLNERSTELDNTILEMTAGGPPADTFWISVKIGELKRKLVELLERY